MLKNMTIELRFLIIELRFLIFEKIIIFVSHNKNNKKLR